MASFDVSYTYDGAGNRISETDNLLGQTTLYSYDAANRLLTMVEPGGTTTFTYDPSGNRTRKETPAAVTDYTYDAKDRLIKIEPVSGDVELTYNAAGVRVRKETPGEVKKFIYDLENLLQETDADGLTERAYTQSTEEYGDLISQHADDETSYPEFDAQWSTAVLLDENESVTDRYRYRAFGVEDLLSISIGAFHIDGLKAALTLQQQYGDEIFAFSEESSPNVVPLSSVTSSDDLAEKLKLR